MGFPPPRVDVCAGCEGSRLVIPIGAAGWDDLQGRFHQWRCGVTVNCLRTDLESPRLPPAAAEEPTKNPLNRM